MPKEIKVYVTAPAVPASPPVASGGEATGRYVVRQPAPRQTAGVDALPKGDAPPAPQTALVAREPAPAETGVTTEVSTPSRPRMLEVLPEKYLETRPPLMYRLVKESEATHTYARIAKSRVYRANAFSCTFFYKPISRCLIEWEE